MKAYVLTIKGNGRLVDGRLPSYPATLPPYELVYATTTKDNIVIPTWYRNCARFEPYPRTWCCWISKLKLIKEHINKYPDEDLLLLEDDVRFLPGFDVCYTSFMSKVPEDWGIIWLGGRHLSTPREVVPGVLLCGKMCNTECTIMRSTELPAIVSALESEHSSDGLYWSDQVISSLRDTAPHYAPIRQFAWQQPGLISTIMQSPTSSENVFNFNYIDINNKINISTDKELLIYT